MKVLIIGHNAISETNNMGKTLLSYFRAFSPDDVAELYIQDKDPKNADVAKNYFRVTDREAFRSIFGKKVGTEFHLEKSEPESDPNTTGVYESIRQYGRKRNATVYAVRNAVWSLSRWKSKKLVSWLRDFGPDVIFFMAGDYGFMFDLTREVSDLLGIPVVVCCVDDYFLYNRNSGTLLGRTQHKSYMKSVTKLMNRASCILTISDMMRDAYGDLFGKPCFTMHTGARRRDAAERGDGTKHGVAYFGNLGYSRNRQIVEIGKAVRRLGIAGIDGVEVYSAEKNPEILKDLTPENGIMFMGRITADEVARRMDECVAVIFTESFNERDADAVRYSVSTKIADLLMNGPCIIAYGPEGIASVDYLKKNEAAYVITDPRDLDKGLLKVLTDDDLRRKIVKKARALAAANHDDRINSEKLAGWLEKASKGEIRSAEVR